MTERKVAIGAVYATLDRLESKGLASSTRRKLAGKSRRIFGITAAGREALERSRAMRDALWKGVDLGERSTV